MSRVLPPASVGPKLTRRRLCSEAHKAQPWGLYRGLLERGAVHRVGGARVRWCGGLILRRVAELPVVLR